MTTNYHDMANFHVISVESRKGGIGKTTIALNLALILNEVKQCEVLFLDLDIAGTDASSFIRSLEEQRLIWKDKLHVLRDPLDKTRDLNLVDLFEQYMMGEEVPEVLWEGKNTLDNKALMLLSGKINIFSSSLSRGNGRRYNYSPNLLFDEMHSAWFITMIKSLIEKCARSLGGYRRLVAIIDNAPGYSGLEPSVEEWLTNLGPELGKFLFVCSLESQDIKASIKSVGAIHSIYREKWTVSRDFLASLRKNGQIKTEFNNRQDEFFIELLESIPREYNNCLSVKRDRERYTECERCKHRCEYSFYLQQPEKDGEEYASDASRYIALVANKVPPLLYGKYSYKIGSVMKDLGANVQEELAFEDLSDGLKLGGELNNIYPVLRSLPKRMIPFIEELSYQFVADKIKPSGRKTSKIGDEWQSTANRLEKTRSLISTKISERKEHAQDLSEDRLVEQALLCFDIDNALVESIDQISQMGIREIERFWERDYSLVCVHISFFLDTILATKRHFLGTELYDLAFKFVRNGKNRDILTSKEFRTKADHYMSIESVEENKKISRNRDYVRAYKSIARALILTEAIFSTQTQSSSHDLEEIDFFKKSIGDLASLLYQMASIDHQKSIETVKFRDATTDIRAISSFAEKLFDENVSADSGGTPFIKSFEKPMALAEVYVAYETAVKRFSSIDEDFNYLMDCLLAIVSRGEASNVTLALIKDLIRNVITDKNIPYESGAEYLRILRSQSYAEKGKSDSFQLLLSLEKLDDFNRVLRSVLSKGQWQLL